VVFLGNKKASLDIGYSMEMSKMESRSGAKRIAVLVLACIAIGVFGNL
jgi:hypothetical protein